jgi:hypothetical protein
MADIVTGMGDLGEQERREKESGEKRGTKWLGGPLAADSSEDAKLAQNQDIDVHGFVVAHQMSVTSRACGVAFDVKNDVFLVFEAASVFQRDQESPGIVMNSHLLRSGRTPDSKISERSLLAGKGLLLRDSIPFAALLEDGISKTFPNEEGARDGGLSIELVFALLAFFRQFCGQVFLRGLLGALIPHGPVSRRISLHEVN